MKDSGRPHNFEIQLRIKGLHTLKYCGDGLRGCVMVLLEMPCKDAFSTCTQTIMASADVIATLDHSVALETQALDPPRGPSESWPGCAGCHNNGKLTQGCKCRVLAEGILQVVLDFENFHTLLNISGMSMTAQKHKANP